MAAAPAESLLPQVINSTKYILEVCLVTIEDADWQMIAARAGETLP